MYSSYIFVCWIFHLTHALCIFRIINFIILQKKKKKIDIKLDRHKRQSKQYLIFSFNERIYNFQYKYNINKWLMVEYLIYLYITKSWSVAFNAAVLTLRHISCHVILFYLFYFLNIICHTILRWILQFSAL